MASSVLDYITVRAPSYTADPRTSVMIDQATIETGSLFGTNRNRAISLLVLHWLTMDDRAAGIGGSGSSIGGTIKREREGSLEREYMVDFSLTKMFPDLTQTRFGMELIELRKKSLVISPFNRFSAELV
jgi:hypothetical protein